jgi:hypothetical protein
MQRNQFRALVVFTLLLTILSIVYDFFCADPIAEKLFAYQDILEPDWSDTKLYLLAGTISLAVLTALVGFVGLLVFWNFARHLFLSACVLFLVITPFIGPYITSGANQALYNVVNVLSGLILGLVYFSPVKHYFVSETSPIDSEPGC